MWVQRIEEGQFDVDVRGGDGVDIERPRDGGPAGALKSCSKCLGPYMLGFWEHLNRLHAKGRSRDGAPLCFACFFFGWGEDLGPRNKELWVLVPVIKDKAEQVMG